MRRAPHQHHLEDRELEREVVFLRHRRNQPRQRATIVGIQRAPEEFDAAASASERAADYFQQRGFAGAVGTDDCEHLTGAKLHRNAAQCLSVAITRDQIGGPQHSSVFDRVAHNENGLRPSRRSM